MDSRARNEGPRSIHKSHNKNIRPTPNALRGRELFPDAMSHKQTGGAAVESAAVTEFGRLTMPRGFKRPGEEQAESPKLARTSGEDTGGERTHGADKKDALESRTAVVLHRPQGRLQRDPQRVAPAVVGAELGLRDQPSASMNHPNLPSAPHPVDDSSGKNAFRTALEQAP
jgi:hypothetical protein